MIVFETAPLNVATSGHDETEDIHRSRPSMFAYDRGLRRVLDARV